ncbi:CBS and ACT domain-containing protein [Desulfoplanes sp.]
MLVKNWMTEGCINLSEETNVLDASEIMRRTKVRQFPVIDSRGGLVGIVSDRDIRDAMPSKYLPGDPVSNQETNLLTLRVSDIMTIDPLVTSPEETVETVAAILLQNKIGALPVLDGANALVGIITEIDVLRYLCATSGGSIMAGIQLIFEIEDTAGATIDLLGYLQGEKIRLTSVLTSYKNVENGHRRVSIRVQSTGDHSLETLAEFLRKKFKLTHYVKDGRAVAVD